MAYLGVLFSLSQKEVQKLKSFLSDEDRLDYLQEEIEEVYFEDYPERFAELEKSWDALHRSLTNGKLEWDNGSFPLNHTILGGELIYRKRNYIMSLKTPEQVKEIYSTLKDIAKTDLRTRYNKIDSKNYGFELTEEDFEYTWDWFEESKEFWKKADLENRYVLFTADQ
ncbi:MULTISPECIES: YfbM family protein [unclassified Tenacibaculum]|uniref:YfbM family protein n=1 Tax=unclassified Tenacibaculum TaxID=2635139 RepID=UPI001F1E8E74|nr:MULTISPECIES: YfbM family protein [unclassified Tenacibaculum]MCF2875558.1 YfbM family protein [Tenacibaculum sp. Cn5-1]MCF2935634.1 YfbM family protein [Tenacibaculum sp. Cn5-34]MCG7512194.1 YfbM family protein [Tenacibaculum sp. Cn5-46]